MGKTQKSPNAQLKLASKRAEVSDTESESSSGEEIRTGSLNSVTKIKTEPQYTTDESESTSEDTELTQKNTPTNLKKASSSRENNSASDVHHNIKQEKHVVNKSSDSENEKYIFQSKKYQLNQSTSGNLSINNKNQTSQNHNDSSSSDEENTLRSAFLGQSRGKSKKKTSKKTTQQNVKGLQNLDNSTSEDTSDEETQTILNETLRKKATNQNVSKTPSLQKTVPSPRKNKKSTPESSKQLKKKSDTNISPANKNINIDKTPEKRPVQVQPDDQENAVTTKSKVQVLQHIKLTPKKPQELLAELYPNLTPVKLNDDFHISSNEEVFYLRIPKTINPQDLLNKELDLMGGSKLKIGKKKYELEPTDKVPDPVLLVGNQSRVICPINSFFLKKHIKLKKSPDLETVEKAMVPFPEDLKQRHPLFGSDYQDKIKLSSEVEERLQNAINNILKQEEKAKKKKKKTSIDHTHEVIFSLLDSHTTSKSSHLEEQYDSAFGSSESQNILSKKKKTKRKSLDESISSPLVAKDPPILVETVEHLPKKRKSKNKSNDMESILNAIKTEMTETNEEVENPKSLLEGLSIIVSPEKKSNKRQLKRRSSVFDSDQSMFESTRIDAVKPEFTEELVKEDVSKKQHLIDETLNNIKTELLTEYESGGEEKIAKKKKKKRKSLETKNDTQIENEMLNNIKQEIMSDFGGTSSKKRKRTSSVVEPEDYFSEVGTKKTKKSRKNTSSTEGRFSLDHEVDNLLEKVKRDKKLN